jgi:cobalamin biosynthesis Co2+ chelatase CbiK
MVAEVIFIASVVVLVYTYIGYPALVYVLSLLFGRNVRTANVTPRVSVIIAARNEERDIAAKLENTWRSNTQTTGWKSLSLRTARRIRRTQSSAVLQPGG